MRMSIRCIKYPFIVINLFRQSSLVASGMVHSLTHFTDVFSTWLLNQNSRNSLFLWRLCHRVCQHSTPRVTVSATSRVAVSVTVSLTVSSQFAMGPWLFLVAEVVVTGPTYRANLYLNDTTTPAATVDTGIAAVPLPGTARMRTCRYVSAN